MMPKTAAQIFVEKHQLTHASASFSRQNVCGYAQEKEKQNDSKRSRKNRPQLWPSCGF
jgi:hypothetical protein